MMSTTTLIFVALALAVVIAAVSKGQNSTGRAGEKPRRKAPITKNEAAMYNRLTQSLPDLVVLAQVSFGALLTAKSRGARNTFDRKIADFVVCDKALQVLAIVELDDASHKGKEDGDAARDALLTQAGYRVLRYARVPDVERVRADFSPPKDLETLAVQTKV